MAIGNLVPWRWDSLRSFDEAKFKDGVLTIDLPKTKEAQERVKQNPVNAA